VQITNAIDLGSLHVQRHGVDDRKVLWIGQRGHPELSHIRGQLKRRRLGIAVGELAGGRYRGRPVHLGRVEMANAGTTEFGEAGAAVRRENRQALIPVLDRALLEGVENAGAVRQPTGMHVLEHVVGDLCGTAGYERSLVPLRSGTEGFGVATP